MSLTTAVQPDPTVLSTPTAGITQDQTDARAIINQYLQQAGLSSLADWAWGEITKGATAQQVELDLYQQPTFKTRFPAIFDRQAKGLPPLSVADYLNYEDSATQLFRAAGIPTSVVDINAELANDVSFNELQSKVQDSYLKVTQSPPAVRDAFNQFYGPNGDAALATYFLDPTKASSALQQQADIAQVAGLAWQNGINIDQNKASEINSTIPTTNVSRLNNLNQGFQTINQQAPLFQETLGEHNDLTAANQGVNAQFGLDATSASDLQKRLQGRVSAAKGQTGVLSSQQGFVGLGSAKPV